MKFNSETAKRVAMLSAVVLVVQMGLTWVYSKFGYTLSQVFAISPQSAVGSQTVGNILIGYLMGILPIGNLIGTFQGWLAMFVGAFILITLGMYAYDMFKVPKAKNEAELIWAVLFYGTAVLYIFLLITKWAAVGTIGVPLLIGLAINYAVLAYATSMVAKQIPGIRI
jgi:hypothetical protein